MYREYFHFYSMHTISEQVYFQAFLVIRIQEVGGSIYTAESARDIFFTVLSSNMHWTLGVHKHVGEKAKLF